MPEPAAEFRTVLPVRETTSGSAHAIDARHQSAGYGRQTRPRAPERAPNVVVILIDDMGFGASSPFGGPCEMPAADRLAAGGLRYTRFHTTAVCSPTRRRC